jgi:hypothetical protein
MTLYVQSLSGNRKQYIVNTFDDLDQLIDQFPGVKEIALFSHSIEEAVESIAEYLSGHHMDAWIEGKTDVTKSINGAMASLGLAAAAALMPIPASSHSDNVDTKAMEMREAAQFKPFGTAKEDKFLHNLMQLESAGGKMINHEKVKHGHLKGEKAVGRWGMMPSTMDEVLSRLDRIGKLHPSMKPLRHMDRDARAAYLAKKPHVELELARYLARHVMARNKGDVLRAAYSWNNGHNLYPHEISDEELQESSYVKDFAQLAHGQPVRGLTPMKMFGVPAGVKKSEKTFGQRLKSWKKHRDLEKLKNPTIVTRTANTEDLGSKRDPELDRRPPTTSREKLVEAIRQANEKNR